MFDFIAKLFPGNRATSPADADDPVRRGETHLQRGELDLAEACFRRAIAVDARRSEAHRLLGSVLQARGDRRGAIDQLTEAMGGGTAPESAYRDLCLLLFQEGRVERAAEIARDGIAAFPSSAELRTYLGNLLAHQGDFAGAADSYRRALAIGPATAELHFNLGIALGRSGAPDEALASYRQAIELEPAFAAAQLNLGNALQRLGRPQEALSHYEHAIRLAPDLAEAHLGAANAHLGAGNPDRALACCTRARALRPDDVRVHDLMGTLLLGQGKVDEALASYGEAVRIKPDDVDGLLGLGNALLQRGDRERAIERYREVLRLDPGNGIAHLLGALTGAGAERAPDRYVAKLFDDYAERFDAHLVRELRYGIPGKIAELLAPHADPSRGQWDVLDLGCGTGLVASAIAPLARRIVGVDLSPRMLDKARALGVYERLEQADLHAMMLGEPASSYDLVTAADVFVYVGKLDDIVREAARLLRPGGRFVFSVESLDALPEAASATERGFALNPTGRYAHAAAYLQRLASGHAFTVVESKDTHVRWDKGRPIDGYLALWRRTEAPLPAGPAPDGSA